MTPNVNTGRRKWFSGVHWFQSQYLFFQRKHQEKVNTFLPFQGRLVYGTVEPLHPQSPLHLIDDIRYK